MPDYAATIRTAGRWLERHRSLLLPLTAAGALFVMLVPLPPLLMDVLLAANIALSALILLTTIYISHPLEFSVFPSVLLGATLLRLVLNVATTRLILTAGASGLPAEQAHTAAPGVIWAFGEFVAGGSLAVGLILFAIIAIIQFAVVTKGATRISEVAARFVLDAMPGKQMAIDSDLSGGLITQQQAHDRRETIAREADFYGAMDGAGKFVRGEAVASVLITLINLLGGLYVGLVQFGWDWGQTTQLFSRLTIGDGLVMQVPALIVSVSAALLVTRSTGKTNLGEQVVSQLSARPIAIGITAALLGVLLLTPLPKLPLLGLGATLAALTWVLTKRRAAASPATDVKADTAAKPAPSGDENVDHLLSVDLMQIDLGYSLVRLVDSAAGGDLLKRVSTMRQQLAVELGLIVPPIRIRDNLRLEAHSYVIMIRGARVASGRLYLGQLLAVGGEAAGGAKLVGRQTSEPAFGTPAVWISHNQRQAAEAMNYTVVEPVSVLITHLGETIRRHAAELMSRHQVEKLLESLKARSSSLVRDVCERLKVSQIQRVLQDLLRERVSIRDLETVFEALSEASLRSQEPAELTEMVRSAVARNLCQQYVGDDGRLWCVTLDEQIEGELLDQSEQVGAAALVPPEMAARVAASLAGRLGGLIEQGHRPVVLCAPQLRPAVKRLLMSAAPDAAVLGYNEVESVEVRSVAKAGIE